MREAIGDLFTYPADAIAVTTNGYRKKDGTCVMGRGCAEQLAKLVPSAPQILGQCIEAQGNRVHFITRLNHKDIYSFPVKPVASKCWRDGSNVVRHKRGEFREGDWVPGWACVAEPGLIEKSARQLVIEVDRVGYQTVVIPRPGCGAGELDWQDVRDILCRILDDRFVAITFPNSK